MKFLITAFEPFNGEVINPSREVLRSLPEELSDAELIKCEIPTAFSDCVVVTREAIIKHSPDYVLNIGQAGGRFAITPERIAINIDDAPIPDNNGNQPIDQVIQIDGAAAYFTQLPVKAIVANIQEHGLPASLSNSAGTFVCNHIMYQVQYMIHKEYPNLKAGFVHVPFLPAQVINKSNQPSMSLADIKQAIRIAIETIIEFDGKDDMKAVEGKTQ